MNYQCHICQLETKLNVMMSSHYKKAHADIKKIQYKEDLLLHNGRAPKYCKTCGKKTHINKGEKQYNNFCNNECYKKFTIGSNNSQWIGGKTTYNCAFCEKEVNKYSSMVEGKNLFCSISCSTRYYYCEKNDISIADYVPRVYDYDYHRLEKMRKICFEEANYSCDTCKKRGITLNAHHMNNKKFFPTQVYELSNLVCLCIDCHNRFHSVYGPGRDTPNTEKQYLIFRSCYEEDNR